MSQAVHPKGPLGAPTAAAFSRPEVVPQKDDVPPQPVPTPQLLMLPGFSGEEEADEVTVPDQDQEPDDDQEEEFSQEEDELEDEPEPTPEPVDRIVPSTPSTAKVAPWIPQSVWKHLLYQLKVNSGLGRIKDRVDYAEALGDALFELGSNTAIRLMVASASGGATKSTTLANLATVFSFWLNQRVVVIDNNPDFDPIDEFLGINPDDTLSVRQVAKIVPTLTSARELQSQLAWTPYGVGLICSDSEENSKSPYTYRMSRAVINMAYRNFGYTFINSGTSIRNPVVKAGLGETDVVVVPALPTSPKMRGAKFAATKLAAVSPEKLQHAIFMMNATEPGHDVEEYRATLGMGSEQILLGSPYDDRLEHNAAADLTNTKLLTIIAYLELAVTSLLVARHRSTNPGAPPLDIGPGRVLDQLNKSGFDPMPKLPWAPKKSH